MNKLYSVHDHWTDINKKNDVDIESIDGVITGIKVNGEDYGGTSWTEVFSGDVVTTGEAAPFSGTINAVLSGADTIKVFYNDGVYILPKQVTDDGIFYGAPAPENPSNIDFSEIPFLIKLGEVSTALYTQSPGPQNLTILVPQSGGGSSDFSTARVTVNSSTSLMYKLELSNYYDYDNTGIMIPSISSGDIDGSKILNAILYKGQAMCIFKSLGQNFPNISVSGNIQDVGQLTYIITGDCTITIS